MSFLDIIKIVGIGLAAAGAVAAAVWVVHKIINKRELKKQLEENFEGYFKALIMKKRQNAVDVGIFDEDEDEIEEKVTIKSEKGIGKDIYEGMIIECCGY